MVPINVAVPIIKFAGTVSLLNLTRVFAYDKEVIPYLDGGKSWTTVYIASVDETKRIKTEYVAA